MPVVLDLRGLTFLDTMGLSVLIELASTSPRPVKLVQGPASVQRIFQLTNTEARLEWQDPATLPSAKGDAPIVGLPLSDF